ncbi:MAG: DUF1996 domain-containing protein [Actinomycetota bacterium]
MRRAIAAAVGVMFTLGTLVTSAPAQYGREVGKGLFWVECDVTTEERSIDPIMAFGGISAHEQVIFGSKLGRRSTGNTLRARGFTTCSAPVDFSGYWVPTFHDADGNLVTPDDIVVYFYAMGDRTRVPFPQDFGRVSEEVYYTCGRGTPRGTDFRSCPAPTSPRMIIIFKPGPGDPNFPETRLGIRWTSQVGADPSTWTASSDPGPMHGDFLNAWKRRDLRMLIDKCLNDPTPVKCGMITPGDL